MELFVDPAIQFPMLKVATKLLKKKLGFRMLMDLIPLDATLVKGSHGAIPNSTREFPLIIVPNARFLPSQLLTSTEVYEVMKRAVLH